jgi:hypothetical protein
MGPLFCMLARLRLTVGTSITVANTVQDDQKNSFLVRGNSVLLVYDIVWTCQRCRCLSRYWDTLYSKGILEA